MPTYNRAGDLRETIPYVLRQSFHDFELLIFDDGSTDETAGVVREFDDSRIRYVRDERNRGVPEVLNRIVRLAH